MAVVHRTYTPFDMRAVTIQGLSAKPAAPGEKPIGKFGTGLKYALAVLLREGNAVRIITPDGEYKFSTKQAEFRGVEYGQIGMRFHPDGAKKPKPWQLLPFTTHYGSNWEMWMAFREIHSNTLDEGGWTKGWANPPEEVLHVSEGCAIVVEGEAYDKEFWNSHNTFLKMNGREPILSTPTVDIWELPHEEYVTEFKYYRGLRAGKAPADKMMLFIYNVKAECYLSEERQVSDHYWDWHVMQAIAECDNEDLIKRFLEAEDGFWESTVLFRDEMRFGETFMRAAGYAKVPARHYERIEAKRPKSIEQLAVEEYPTPWRVNTYSIVADNGNKVASKPSGMAERDFQALWKDRLEAVNKHAPSAAYRVPEVEERVNRDAEPWPEADEAPAVAVEGVEKADELGIDLDKVPF